jgi:glycosyltransferase involved in cell wall biosynthesis
MKQMRVSHYFEFEDKITGGIRESVRHQRKALEKQGIEYTTEPDLEADILHINLAGPRSVYYARKASKKGVPVVMHTHVTAEDFGESFRFSNTLAYPLKPYLKWAYSHADRLICPSEYNRGVLEDYTDTSKTVITNGWDQEKLEGFNDLREEYLEKYDLEPPVVFLVGHVLKRKGLDDFVETAEGNPDLDFAWFGPLDRELKGRETKKLIDNSPDNCTFTGYIDDVRGAFAAGDIFFFPTNEENEGIALLEAMGCGKPLLIKDIETFDWLEDGEECIKVREDFSKGLEELRDSDTRERLGKNAKKRSQEFTLEKVGENLEKLYADLV